VQRRTVQGGHAAEAHDDLINGEQRHSLSSWSRDARDQVD
jgi:hypothetical protein